MIPRFTFQSNLSLLTFVTISKSNYPGGDLFLQLISYHQDQSSSYHHHLESVKTANINKVNICIDVASAMSGVTLFMQEEIRFRFRDKNLSWNFNKAGFEEENQFDESSFKNCSYVLSEEKFMRNFKVIKSAKGHPKMEWKRMKIETLDAIFLHERI